MEAETPFVYSHTELLLQNVRLSIPFRKDSPLSFQFPQKSVPFGQLSLNNKRELPAPKKHELLAMNGYIDKNIVPGFRYRVREIETQKKLFDGEAKYLESIGQGYGKRLTFETDDILENDNFFWTDSNEHGYAFSIEAISVGDIFVAKLGNRELGFVKITSVQENQKIDSSEVEDRSVVKKVKVDFQCKMAEKWNESTFGGKFSLNLQGVATLVKGRQEQRSKIQDIKISNQGGAIVLQPVS